MNALERLRDIRSLLLELGRDGNNPTETELVLGCRDGARAIHDALDEIEHELREERAMRMECESRNAELRERLESLRQCHFGTSTQGQRVVQPIQSAVAVTDR